MAVAPTLRPARPARSPARRRVSPRGTAADAAASRVERAYRHLKTAIVSVQTTPGAPLNEQDVAARLGMSRTPVREAIRRLEQEGLVVRHPRRGVVVAPLSMQDVLEIWQLREILEPAACRLAAGRLAPAALAGIERTLSALVGREPRLEDYERHHQADVALHRLIAQGTGNARLLQILESLTGRIAHVRMAHSPTRFRRALREHLDILAALRRGDPEAAAKAMRVHLANARAGLATLA